MPVLRNLGRVAYVGVRAGALLAAGVAHLGRFLARCVGAARRRASGGEAGMMRLLDLHAASCAGDTLVAIGLAGTVFFPPSGGDARGKVAMYLLMTMLPFALLAPVVGPVLDRLRHGRRYALALTFLGRAFLAYMISDHIGGYTLYPAAFGMLVLSRAYGVARSAAVPRMLPAGLGLSESGARAAVIGAAAGALVAPLGALAYAVGPEWPLRLSMVVFVAGMVTALRLPPRADAQPPERVPRVLQRPGNKSAKILSGRLVWACLAGSATLRAVYGFLALFLAFSIRSHDLPTRVLGAELTSGAAIGLVAASLGVGSLLATAMGTVMRVRRPVRLQAVAITVVAGAAVAAAARYDLAFVAPLCLITAVGSGLVKLAVDAVIQERTPERVRASAFAHSETLLMVAWVIGGALGLVKVDGRVGLCVAAAFGVFGAIRAIVAAARLRRERLSGKAAPEVDADAPTELVGAASAEPDGKEPEPGRAERLRLRQRDGSTGDGKAGVPAAEATAATTAATTAPARVLVKRGRKPPELVDPDGDQSAPPGYHLYRPTRRG